MFEQWSPLQLCHVLGYRVDLRSQGGGTVAYLVGPAVRDRSVTYLRAIRLLKRMARRKGVNEFDVPATYRRALRDGKEQVK
ncbi:hypothetical protein EVB39_089 [Rhizobium phage RHph_TM3_3_9]|nr:hypothetical protein EVB39_089 [Rhizobium phage RHph_TM3_3_9]QIG68610.1 hypothetical protein EVB66_089 [Rhizobium phage RHph_TM3_3_13]QIG74468.1 hypothetical protein EVC09_088 [Rhizobium phage RHph_TM3_3_10]QXV74582.1 hypothetical protein [Rhizobium phage RHEph19]